MQIVPHVVEQTTNKHSRAILKDGKIVIRLARRLTKHQQQEHIDSLLRRMTKHIHKAEKKEHIDPFRPLLNGESTLELSLANGHRYSICLEPGRSLKVQIDGSQWNVHIGPSTNQKELHRLLWKTFSTCEHDYLDALVREINVRTFNVPITKTRMRIAKTQWGSCTHSGTIMLNAALLFVPIELLEYVIIHELAHRIHANHSPRYWKCVEKVLPNYQELRKQLKEYRLPEV